MGNTTVNSTSSYTPHTAVEGSGGSTIDLQARDYSAAEGPALAASLRYAVSCTPPAVQADLNSQLDNLRDHGWTAAQAAHFGIMMNTYGPPPPSRILSGPAIPGGAPGSPEAQRSVNNYNLAMGFLHEDGATPSDIASLQPTLDKLKNGQGCTAQEAAAVNQKIHDLRLQNNIVCKDDGGSSLNSQMIHKFDIDAEADLKSIHTESYAKGKMRELLTDAEKNGWTQAKGDEYDRWKNIAHERDLDTTSTPHTV